MSEEIKREAVRDKFINIMSNLSKWPEDRVKTILKDRLEREGWNITTISMGQEQGKDLEAVKGEWTIHIEAKGEPKSPNSYRQERRQFIGGALMSLITCMTEENVNRKFCIAFPDNEYYLSGVLTRIPSLIRKKLNLFAMFLQEDASIRVLMPSSTDTKVLFSFDELF